MDVQFLVSLDPLVELGNHVEFYHRHRVRQQRLELPLGFAAQLLHTARAHDPLEFSCTLLPLTLRFVRKRCQKLFQIKVALDIEALCTANSAEVVYFRFVFLLKGWAEPSG